MMPAEITAQAHALLLDFDGPVCAVFAGIPASLVADQLRQILAEGSDIELPSTTACSEDPFDILRYAANLGDAEAQYIEVAFRAHEVEAIKSAAPTEGAHDLIRTWHQSGRPIAIVSNNSVAAISAYLDLYDLHTSIDVVSARTSSDISLLKPNAHLLRCAIDNLNLTAKDCVFIGDSINDMKAARAANVPFVAYLNKPNKSAIFGAADAITESISGLRKNL